MKTLCIPCDSTSFTAHEMSVEEIQAWYQALALPGEPCDIVGEYAIPGISLKDLALICHCPALDFDPLTYRELERIADGARELNPHFFRLRALIAETAEKIVAAMNSGFASPGGVA